MLLRVFLVTALWTFPAIAADKETPTAGLEQFPDDIHEIDMAHAWELQNRSRRGDSLSAADSAFVQRAMDYRRVWQALLRKRRLEEALSESETRFLDQALEARRRAADAARARYREEHPPRDSTGLVPLVDLSGPYRNFEGGLYPGGGNRPPDDHLAAGRSLAEAVTPLDAQGNPDPKGAVVLISVGMSNTTQEFQAFLRLAEAEPGLNPHLVLVDGAQGGQAANTTADPEAAFWAVQRTRLEERGVAPEQVQIAWIKQAVPNPGSNGRTVPQAVARLKGYMVDTVHNLKRFYPNIRIAYLSSRIYAGYAESSLNPEPYAYAGGFAMKGLIADQVSGAPELNYNPAAGPVRTPWLAWGPYLWADGLKPRSDGLTYLRADLADDGTHPSPVGRLKVARQLLRFFRTDPTSMPWFLE